MIRMKILSKIITAGFCIFASSALFADTYTLASGEAHDGTIYKILDDKVSIKSGDQRLSFPISDFDAASQEAIKAWAVGNPHKVDVYAKWDAQPVIKSSVMPRIPEQFQMTEFKGMVSVDLVLDETGQVMHASIKKSTHSELEGPSLEAAKTWLFEPAMVAGKAVKAKLRIPFRFAYTPPVAEDEPAA